MIAYNKTTLDNVRIIKKAKQWYAQQLLSTEQFATITANYKSDFYTPNLFIKIGLFIFTCISIIAALGLFVLLFFQAFNNSNNNDAFAIGTCLLFAIACTFLLEMFIKRKRIYRSGVDEALLYATLIFISTAMGFLFDEHPFYNSNTTLAFFLILIPILIVATIHYSDVLVAIVLSLCCYTVFFLLLLKLGSIAKLIMPFALMFISIGIYLITKQLKQKAELIYWQSSIIAFECVALFVFYASGNYFVIRESSIKYFDLTLENGQDIPLAILFYLFTAIVPIVYIYYGLKQKNKILLWTGLLLVAASAITFKNYFSTGHPELILVSAGILMIGIAYAAIKYLKVPKFGITFEEDIDEDNFLKTNAEALLQVQSFGHPTNTQPDNNFEFGGGTGGGGGADSTW